MPYIDTLPESLQRAFRLLDENRDTLRAEIAEQRARDGFDDEIVTQSLSEWAATAGTTAGAAATPERPTTTSGWGKARRLVRPSQGSGNEGGAAPII